ncbi:hypothetical protein ACFQU2_18870 [Siccirubricoccus deserti]
MRPTAGHHFPCRIGEETLHPAGMAIAWQARPDLPEGGVAFTAAVDTAWRPDSETPRPQLLFGPDGADRLECLDTSQWLDEPACATRLAAAAAKLSGRFLRPLQRLAAATNAWAPDGPETAALGLKAHVERLVVVPGFGALVAGWALSPQQPMQPRLLRLGERVLPVLPGSITRTARRDLLENAGGSARLAASAGFTAVFAGPLAPEDAGEAVLKLVTEGGIGCNHRVAPAQLRLLGHSAEIEELLTFYPALEREAWFPDLARAIGAGLRRAAARATLVLLHPAPAAILATIGADRSDAALLLADLALLADRRPDLPPIVLLLGSGETRATALAGFGDAGAGGGPRQPVRAAGPGPGAACATHGARRPWGRALHLSWPWRLPGCRWLGCAAGCAGGTWAGALQPDAALRSARCRRGGRHRLLRLAPGRMPRLAGNAAGAGRRPGEWPARPAAEPCRAAARCRRRSGPAGPRWEAGAGGERPSLRAGDPAWLVHSAGRASRWSRMRTLGLQGWIGDRRLYPVPRAARTRSRRHPYRRLPGGEPQPPAIRHPGERALVFAPERNEPFYNPGSPGLARRLVALLRAENIGLASFHHHLNIGLSGLQMASGLPGLRSLLTLHEYTAICQRDGQMVTRPGQALCHAASAEACTACFPEHELAQSTLRRNRYLGAFANIGQFIAPSRFLMERYIAWGCRGSVSRSSRTGCRAWPERRPLHPARPATHPGCSAISASSTPTRGSTCCWARRN